MRWLLVAGTAAMALLALLSLRRSDLPFRAQVVWGLVAILLPLVGPFVVIWRRT